MMYCNSLALILTTILLTIVSGFNASPTKGNSTIGPFVKPKAANSTLAKSNDLTPTKRIVGGSGVDINTTPWMVSLQQGGSHFCGASLVDSTTVVTAAHCTVETTADRVTAVMGRDTGSQEAIPASQIFVHEQYQPGQYRNDISVIKLSRPSRVQSFVSLDTQGALGTARVIGWGLTSPSGSLPNQLLGLDVQIADDQECAPILGYDPSVSLCARGQTEQQTPCQGDSGGPLFIAPNRLVGTVSFGMNCVGYAAYARVSTLASWIRSKAGGIGSSPQEPQPEQQQEQPKFPQEQPEFQQWGPEQDFDW